MSGTIAFVQARMGSTRLSGKVLAEIGRRPILEWVLTRLARARRLDRTVVVTTCQTSDDVLAGWLSQRGWPYYRGSELDVLDRYYQAALATGAETVVRITSDNPLIDPELVDDVVQLREHLGADYANNFGRKRLPLGLSVEACTFAALERAWREAAEPLERTHVTPYLYLHPELFNVKSVPDQEEDMSHLRWTVDTPEDLKMLNELYDAAGDRLLDMNWREVLEILRQNETIGLLNRDIRQKALQEL